MGSSLPIADGEAGTDSQKTGPRLRATAFQGSSCLLLGEAESQGPRALLCRELHDCHPEYLPLAQMRAQGCGSWEMPGPTLLTLRPLSSKPVLPTSCPGDVSSGQREGSPGVGEGFPEAPRTWPEKGLSLCPGSRSFHKTVTATNYTSPTHPRLLFHFICL